MFKLFLLLSKDTKLNSIESHLVNVKFIDASSNGSVIRIDSKDIAHLVLYCANISSSLEAVFNDEKDCISALRHKSDW